MEIELLAFKIKCNGEMAEWSNALAWKAGKGATPSRVRIPFSPPKKKLNGIH